MGTKKKYREPRDGEVRSWLSWRATEVRDLGNVTGSGHELRVRPSKCCGHDKPNNPSLQINEKSGLWRCFKCDQRGNWFTFTRTWGEPLDVSDRYAEDYKPVDPVWVEKMQLVSRQPVSRGHYPELIKYLASRSITVETADEWRVSTKGPNNLRWPIYAVVNGQWAMVNARLCVCIGRKEAKVSDWFEQRGGETNLLIGNHLLDLTRPEKRVIITEGQWDAMTATQLGFKNVFSLPNGASHIEVGGFLRHVPEDWTIWLAMDMDKAGDMAAEKFFAQLGSERLYRLKMPFKDLNDWLQADHELSMKKVEACVVGQNLNKEKQEGFFSIDLEAQEVEDKKVIATFPWGKLNSLFAGGLYRGQTTGLLAPSGVGKSTFCNQIAAYSAGQLIKTGIISLEGSREAYQTKIAAPIKGQWPKERWGEVVENLLVSNLQGKRTTAQQCIDEFSRMVEEGAKLLIIDNLDFIDQGNKAQIYGEMIEFAVNNGVHIIVVWQPNKIGRETVVNSGNQKGYSTTFQDADNYINLNVIDDYVRIEVEKTREEGVSRIDNQTWLVYHKDTRCFEETLDIRVDSKIKSNVTDIFTKKEE